MNRFVAITWLSLAISPLMGQTLDLTLEPGNKRLDIYLTANGGSYSGARFNEMRFTVKWDSSATYKIGPFRANGNWKLRTPIKKLGPQTHKNGLTYQTYGFTSASTNFSLQPGASARIGYILLNNKLDQKGLEPCSFSYRDDSYTTGNSKDYYVRIDGSVQTGNALSRAPIKSVFSNGNWSSYCSLKSLGATDTAEIANGVYTMYSHDTAHTVRVKPNATLQVNSGGLTASSFTVEANANGYGIYIGPAIQATIQQYVGKSAGWRHLGFPVNGDFTTLDLGGAPMNYGGGRTGNLYYFDHVNFEWDSVPNSSFNPNTQMVGVIAYLGGPHFPTSGIISWTGTTNDGTMNATYRYSTPNGDQSYDGWNLVPNPYPSNLDWHLVDNQQGGIFNSISIWDAESGKYSSYNSSSQIAANKGSRYIAPGQSVWIKTGATHNGKPFKLQKSHKTRSGGSVFRGRWTAPTAAIPTKFVKLNVKSQTTGDADETFVYFDPLSTHNYEPQQDAHKQVNPSPIPNLSTTAASGEALVINSYGEFDNTIAIPVSFESDQYGMNYSIDMNTSQLDPAWGSVFLIDRHLQRVHDLGSMGAYNFTHTEMATAQRFELRFSNKTIGLVEPGKDGMHIYAKGNTIAIDRSDPGRSLEVEIYNLTGQMVSQAPFANEPQAEIRTALPGAFYFVRAVDSKGGSQSGIVAIP